MPKVFLIAQPTVTREGKLPNLEPLTEHGEVHVLIDAGEKPTFEPERIMRQITSRLQRFNPEEDSLVWAGGDMLGVLMVGAVLERHGHTRIRWLRYERSFDPATGRRSDEGAKYVVTLIPLYTVSEHAAAS